MLEVPLKAILFDCDGTLLNNIPLHRELHTVVSRNFGLKKPVFFYKQLEKLGFKTADILRYVAELNRLEAEKLPATFGNLTLLLAGLKVRGIKLGIVTNRPLLDHYFTILARAGLPLSLWDFFVNYHPRIFDGLPMLRSMNCYPVRYQKPDRRFLQPIIGELEKLANFPKSVLMVGDSVSWDWRLAKRFGFSCVGVLSGVDDKAAWLKVIPETRIFENVGELLRVI